MKSRSLKHCTYVGAAFLNENEAEMYLVSYFGWED